MMLDRILISVAAGLALLVAAPAVHAQGGGNPFAAGGPLAPWNASLPVNAQSAPVVAAPLATTPSAPSSIYVPGAGPSAGSYYVPGASSPTTAPTSPARAPYVPGLISSVGGSSTSSIGAQTPAWQPYGSEPASYAPQADTGPAKRAAKNDEGRMNVSVIANPALLPWGRMAGRIEVAPLAAHALFFEFAKWDLPISYQVLGQSTKLNVPVYEYGFGYHLYPQGRGVSGFYLGPRFIYAHGEAEQATGNAVAWGADLGYQLVIANHLVLNLGIGVMHISAKANAKQGYLDQVAQAVSSGGSSFSGSVELGKTLEQWVPWPTAGLGLAF
jgi:hypothetical protein